MRAHFVIAAALLLSGCGNTDFFGDPWDDTPAAPATASVQGQATPGPAAATAPSAEAVATPMANAPTAASSPETPSVVVETTHLPPNAHCMTLAKQRAQDAAFQGEDSDTQEAVHDRTYAECVAWDLKHAFR
jgi:hypothetical protein